MTENVRYDMQIENSRLYSMSRADALKESRQALAARKELAFPLEERAALT
jgi:hypothetical protein